MARIGRLPPTAKAVPAPIPVTATVLAGQEKRAVALRPGSPGTKDNLMAGQFGINADPGLRLVGLIQVPGRPSIVARFAF